MLGELDGHGLTSVVPLPARGVEVPVGQSEVSIESLLDLSCPRLKLLRVVDLLLPEVAF